MPIVATGDGGLCRRRPGADDAIVTDALPTLAEHIDPRWLTDALAPRHPGVAVDAVSVTETHEVTNSHAMLAVSYAAPAGAPPTMFCKLPPRDTDRRRSIIETGMGVREARFYADLAPRLPLRVPATHVARHDLLDGAFILLLEDLRAAGCGISTGPEGVTPDSAAVALEELAGLHLRYEDPARRAAEADWVPPIRPGGDYGKILLGQALAEQRDRLTPAFAAIAQLYIDQVEALHAAWTSGPHTVVHGDPHIGNLFDDGGRTGFLDWGIINVNTPLRDVSYFLSMALTVDDRRTHERALLDHWLDIWNASAAHPIGRDDAWLAHRVHAAYCVPASCQIVTFPEGISERRRVFSMAFLARAEAAVDDLDALGAVRAVAGL